MILAEALGLKKADYIQVKNPKYKGLSFRWYNGRGKWVLQAREEFNDGGYCPPWHSIRGIWGRLPADVLMEEVNVVYYNQHEIRSLNGPKVYNLPSTLETIFDALGTHMARDLALQLKYGTPQQIAACRERQALLYKKLEVATKAYGAPPVGPAQFALCEEYVERFMSANKLLKKITDVCAEDYYGGVSINYAKMVTDITKHAEKALKILNEGVEKNV